MFQLKAAVFIITKDQYLRANGKNQAAFKFVLRQQQRQENETK